MKSLYNAQTLLIALLSLSVITSIHTMDLQQQQKSKGDADAAKSLNPLVLEGPITLKNDVAITALTVYTDGAFFVAGNNNGAIEIWDQETLSPARKIKEEDDTISALALFSHDHLASATTNPHGIVTLWDLRAANPIGQFSSSSPQTPHHPAITGSVRALTTLGAEDEQQILSLNEASIIKYTDEDRQTWHTQSLHEPNHTLHGPNHALASLLNNQLLASFGTTAIVLNEGRHNPRHLTHHAHTITALAASRHYIASASQEDGVIMIHDPQTLELIQKIRMRTSFPIALTALPTGDLVSAHHDRTLKLWHFSHAANANRLKQKRKASIREALRKQGAALRQSRKQTPEAQIEALADRIATAAQRCS